MTDHHKRGIDAAQTGLLINVLLAGIKFTAGIVGHSYALIADGIESSSDIVGSLFVVGGLKVAAKPPDEDHPFGHGKAEAIAAACVSLMLIGIAVLTAWEGVRQAFIPHESPASFTLIVLFGVIATKELLFRKVSVIGKETGSHIVKTDAWHHRSDAISSVAAAIGITIALIGGPTYAAADDWAALAAAVVIAINGFLLLMPALHELMDRSPDQSIIDAFHAVALSVEEVLAVEKLRVRKSGMQYYVDIHIQMAGDLSLDQAHRVSGKVKSAFRRDIPSFQDGSIHMEPFDPRTISVRRSS